MTHERTITIHIEQLTYRDVEPIEWTQPCLAHLRANDPLGAAHEWWVREWRNHYRDERGRAALVDLGGES